MPRGIFQVVAVIGDKVLYASSKPQVGDLDKIEKRALVSAMKNAGEEDDPGDIELFVLAYLPIAYVKNPPRPQLAVVPAAAAKQPKSVAAGRSAHHEATHPQSPIRPPKFYKDDR